MKRFSIDSNIAGAHTLHTDYYLMPEHYAASKERIFAPSWQYVGHADMLSGPDNVHPFTLLDGYLNEPLVLTRGTDGGINCMSNVCTHRGNLLAAKPCRAAHLRCSYHGRQFSLDGRFLSMPEFREVQHFPTETDNLHRLPLFTWGKMFFTSLVPDSDPEKYFGAMMRRMNWFPMNRLVHFPHLSRDYQVKANWALYCENYLEGFHIPFVHNALNQELDFGAYTTELFEYSNLQLGIGKKGDVCFDLPSSSPDYGKDVAAYYFWVFPNMLFNFYPWGLSFNLVQPTAIDECRVSFITFVTDESKLDRGAGSGLDSVELEDEEVVANVQRGIRSRFYSQGRYSVTREQGPHHFHSLIAEFMNRGK